MAGGMLRVVAAGSVDDGKSTLIGRLLYDSRQLADDQLVELQTASRRRGDRSLNLALVTDGLRAEREQGITIDVAYRYFQTPRRKFIIADAPGHATFTRNMLTGASTADLALVIVDAVRGVAEQTRRHMCIASLLHIPHMVVCVNKMDLVGYERQAFERIEEDVRAFEARLEIGDLTFIPICALDGDNVVDRSPNMPWYEGPAVLYHLEHVHTASDRNLVDPRFPVQCVLETERAGQESCRGYAGQVAGGVFRPGDDVMVLPSRHEARIASIDTYDGPVAAAFSPLSVMMRLDGDAEVVRGDLICRPHNVAEPTTRFEAQLCWVSERPLSAGHRYIIKHTTRSTMAIAERVRHRIDMPSLQRDPSISRLELNDIGRVLLRTDSPLMLDAYRDNRITGSFILIDEATNATVAAGMALGTRVGDAPSRNITWDPAALSRSERWRHVGQRGATVWLTGLPAAGKSTIAVEFERRLLERGVLAYRLDGDNLRHGINADLGFDPSARTENVRRVGEVAKLLADAGAVAIVSLVSPYRADRDQARAVHEGDGLPFIEAWVDTPVTECERRDPKGLYARARRGDLRGLTGIDDPYEPPDRCELVLDADRTSPEQCVERLLGILIEQELLPAAGRRSASDA